MKSLVCKNPGVRDVGPGALRPQHGERGRGLRPWELTDWHGDPALRARWEEVGESSGPCPLKTTSATQSGGFGERNKKPWCPAPLGARQSHGLDAEGRVPNTELAERRTGAAHGSKALGSYRSSWDTQTFLE